MKKILCFFTLILATSLFAASSSSASSNNIKHCINWDKEITSMHFLEDGTLYFTDENDTWIYNSEHNENYHTIRPTENAKQHITEVAEYKPLITGESICFNSLYLIAEPFVIKKVITHQATISNAFFSFDEHYVIAQSEKQITIAPINEETVNTLDYKNFDYEEFKHISLSHDSKHLAICTKKNNIYLVDIEQCGSLPRKAKSFNKKVQRFWQKFWKSITSNPWRTFALAQAAIITTYTLYKFKTKSWSINWPFSNNKNN